MIKTTQPALHGDQHLADGSDPIPGWTNAPAGDTIDAIIAGLDPAGWWKLNESTGIIAHDSSGNGLDLTADTGPPLWGAPAGPPGEQAADFENGTGATTARVARTWAALTGDFTAGLFVSRNPTTSAFQIMGQGHPQDASGPGWMLWVNPTASSPANTVGLWRGTAAGSIFADNPLAASTWAMIAAVHDGTTWRLNINGLDQASTSTAAYTAASSPLWIGNDGNLGGGGYKIGRFVGSYAFLFPTALSGSELLDIYESATIPEGANAGKALLATGLGGSYWDFAIEVTY